MNFLANITEAVGGLFGGQGTTNGAATGVTAPSSSSGAGGMNGQPPQLTPALRQEQGEIGNILSIRVFDPACTFDCHRLVIDMETKTKAISRDTFKLIITNKQLILLQPLPNQPLFGRVTEVYELHALAKLKYHKSQPANNPPGSAPRTPNKPQLGLLIMELKTGKLINYAMSDPLPAVEVLKHRMQDLGITGNITRPAKTRRIIANAQHCLEQSKEIQLKFSLEPSLGLIEEMMDLLKTATEKFAEVDDKNAFSSSIQDIHRFLQRDDVQRILDRQPEAISNALKAQQQEQQAAQRIAEQRIVEQHAGVNQESLLDTPMGTSQSAMNPSTLSERRNVPDMPLLSPSLYDGMESEKELIRSVKHELLSAMSPKPFRVEENPDVRDLHARALTFDDMDSYAFDDTMIQGGGANTKNKVMMSPSKNLLVFDDEEEEIEKARERAGETDIGKGVIVSSSQEDEMNIHELSAMLEDMDHELEEILGHHHDHGTSCTSGGGVVGNKLEKVDYESLGLEDFDKLLDEI